MDDEGGARAITLRTLDGLALEAELDTPFDAHAAVVLAHPHPLHGGDMRSIVTSVLFAELSKAGIATLRFNFRGVGGSEGSFGEGRRERLDVVAALDAAEAALVALGGALPPIVLVGWSFGADVSLSVDDERLAGWVAIAAPLRILPIAELVAQWDPRPKLLLQPEHDQFRDPVSLQAAVRTWKHTTVLQIRGADHFLVGRTDHVVDAVGRFVGDLAGGVRDAR